MIDKTTQNYANKRNMELVIGNYDNGSEILSIYHGDDDEPMIVYAVCDNGGYIYRGNVWLPQSIKEELPHWIKDNKQLRQVINYLYIAIKTIN